jgi:hypothetical protein
MSPFSRVLSLSLCLVTLPVAAADSCNARSGSHVQPLIELYTSEGCSSCPPADAWLSKARLDTSVNWIAFHVDYWDSLGWKDRYADARYSERQRDRVAAAGERTVYTPQVMAGANIKVKWHNASSLRDAIEVQRTQKSPVDIEMRYDVAGNTLTVMTKPALNNDMTEATLWLAEVEMGLSTEVRRGENSGRVLQHDAVVQRLHGPFALAADSAAMEKHVTLGTDANGKPMQAVAWIEDARQVPRQSLALNGAKCAGVR